LTAITENDVTERKLEILHEKLEEEYTEGFTAEKDPNKLIEMTTLSMTFLSIGPKIENLEFFENLENIMLQHNSIKYINESSFQFNVKLQMLNLSHNDIEEIVGIDHLNDLVYLDLSSN